MKKLLLFLFSFLFIIPVHAQNRNNIWCFGDSAGIDFGSGAPVPISSGMDGRGSCVSIADEIGNLLFYASTMFPYSNVLAYSTFVFDAVDDVMQNGDSIFGQGWYQELVIVPNPANDSTYYLFSIGVAGSFLDLNIVSLTCA